MNLNTNPYTILNWMQGYEMMGCILTKVYIIKSAKKWTEQIWTTWFRNSAYIKSISFEFNIHFLSRSPWSMILINLLNSKRGFHKNPWNCLHSLKDFDQYLNKILKTFLDKSKKKKNIGMPIPTSLTYL